MEKRQIKINYDKSWVKTTKILAYFILIMGALGAFVNFFNIDAYERMSQISTLIIALFGSFIAFILLMAVSKILHYELIKRIVLDDQMARDGIELKEPDIRY